ncbi:MAG: hypothetical protein IJ246_10385 [Clostridia bacterium]|nr:hypothetical protein [Clostridia bacterium]
MRKVWIGIIALVLLGTALWGWNLRKKLDTANQSNATLSDQVFHLTTDVTALTKSLDTERAKSAEQKQTIDSLTQEAQKAEEASQAQLDAMRQKAEEAQASWKEEKQTLEGQVQALENTVKEQDQTIDAMKASQEKAQAQAQSEQEKTLAEWKEETDSLKKQWTEEKEAMTEKMRQAEQEAKAALSQKDDAIAALQTELAEQSQSMEQLREQFAMVEAAAQEHLLPSDVPEDTDALQDHAV